MKINNLSAVALKGQTFNHALGALTLITGRNFAGKTARLDAIRVGLTGIVPELGARTSSTALLAQGAAMGVTLELSGNNRVQRSYRLEKGSWKTDRLTDLTDEEIKRIETSPLLNTSDYFQMTDNERLSYLFANVPLGTEFTADGICARLQRITLEPHTETAEAAKQAWLAVVRKAIANNVVTGLNDLLKKDGGKLTEDYTVANRRSKDTEGAVRVMQELKLREATWSADTIADLETQIEGRNIEAKTASTKLGQMQEQQKQYANLSELRQKLTATAHGKAPDFDAERKLWQAQLDKLSSVTDIPPPNPALVQQLQRELAAATAAQRAADAAAEKARGMCEDVAGKKCCPYCESSNEGWKEKLLARLQKDLNEYSAKADEATKIADAKKVEYDSARKAYEALEVEHKVSVAARQPIAQARSEILSIDRKEQTFKEARASAAEHLKGLGTVEPIDAELVRQQAAHVHDLAMALGELRKRRDDAKRLSQDAARAAQAALEHETAAMQVALIKAIGKELKVIQSEIVDGAFKGLMAVANKVAAGVLRSPLDYHDSDIGRWEGAQWINHKTFSGTEQAIAHIAVAAALSATFPIKIVLLDELARVDDANTKKLLGNLSACVHAGILDQVIAIDVRPHAEEGEWQIIAL